MSDQLRGETREQRGGAGRAYVLDEEGDSAIKVAHVPLEDKVLLRLCRDARLEVTEVFLGC